jgi:hypothetical protein
MRELNQQAFAEKSKTTLEKAGVENGSVQKIGRAPQTLAGHSLLRRYVTSFRPRKICRVATQHAGATRDFIRCDF